VLICKVVLFADVLGQVVQLDLAKFDAHGLPVARSYCLLAVEFPVEVFMLLLSGILAKERRQHGDAVNVAWCGQSGKVGAGGHEIPEGADVVGGGCRFDLARPAGDERYANAAFVDGALEAAEWACTIEETCVRTAGVGGSIVAGEDDQSVVFEAEFLKQCDDLAHGLVHARNHGGVGGPRGFVGDITPAAVVARIVPEALVFS